MYWNVFIIVLAAGKHFSSAQFTTQEPPKVDLSHLGPCSEENHDRLELVKDNSGDEIIVVCSRENDVYAWKETIDDTDDVMDDVMLKREAATKFFERDQRDLNHECYSECCNWEEVREHYEHDIDAAEKYWRKFQNWKQRNGCTRSSSGW